MRESRTSERANELLKRALELQRRVRMEQEAAECFANDRKNSAHEREAYQKAVRRTLNRD